MNKKDKAKKSPAAAKPKQVSIVQNHIKSSILILIVTYFMLDYLMMDTKEVLNSALTNVFVLLTPCILFGYYAFDYCRGLNPRGGTDVPKFIKNKKRYVLIGWLVISLSGITILIAEPFVVPKFFPGLDSTYYQPQIMLMVFIAPVMEEIIFRYLLYDRWLKRKWGWFCGFMVASLVFVLCHPVTDLHSLVVYWVPTVMFFLVYHEFGLYGSIIMHMIYNIVAI